MALVRVRDFGLLTTPSAVVDAVKEGRAAHRIIAIILGALAIRFGVIGLFYNLWWKYRQTVEKSQCA